MKKKKRIFYGRIPQEGWLGGVCAGFAYYFEVPACLIMALFIIAALLISFCLTSLIYIVLWFLIKKAKTTPIDYNKKTEF